MERYLLSANVVLIPASLNVAKLSRRFYSRIASNLPQNYVLTIQLRDYQYEGVLKNVMETLFTFSFHGGRDVQWLNQFNSGGLATFESCWRWNIFAIIRDKKENHH